MPPEDPRGVDEERLNRISEARVRAGKPPLVGHLPPADPLTEALLGAERRALAAWAAGPAADVEELYEAQRQGRQRIREAHDRGEPGWGTADIDP